jgi:uncharacterized RDD family membrane protein YckC
MTEDEILTGEAVALEVRPAGFATRLAAGLIDLVITGALWGLAWWVLFLLGLESLDEAAVNAVITGLTVFFILIVPVSVETLTRGRTVGKLALGYRIVRDDGGPIRLRQALARGIAGIFENWLLSGSVALITAMVSARGKRVGDFLAGTYAARVRGRRAYIPPLFMPPELAAWAGSADMVRLPDGVALRARQFLGRLAQMSPAMRAQVGLALAADVERHVAPPPPLGTHPELFLAAVLAERRGRVAAANAERAARSARLLAGVGRLGYGIPDPPD